jgi:hypothetical protein
LTEAGFAIPTVAAAAGVSATEGVAGAVVVWTATGDCGCVHPAMRSPAMIQAPRIIKIPFLDIIINPR